MTAPGTSFPLPPLPGSGMEANAGGANDGGVFAVVANSGGGGIGKGAGHCICGNTWSGGPCISGTGGGPLNGGWPAVAKCCS